MTKRSAGIAAIRALSVSSAGQSQSDEQTRIAELTKQKLRQLGFAPKGTADTATITSGRPGIRSTASNETPAESAAADTEAAPESTDATAIKEVLSRVEALQNSLSTIQTEAKQEVEAAKTEADAAKTQAADLQAKLQEKEAEATTTATELQAVKEMLGRLESFWKPRGEVQAQQLALTVLGQGSQEMRNWERMIETAPKTTVNSSSGLVQQSDLRAASSYWHKHQSSIRDGVEALMRDKGFFGGSTPDKQAITLASDIPSIAFQYLSTFVRESHYGDLIHSQFANYSVAPGTPPRLNTAVPRYPYRARPTAAADRVLTPGTDLTTAIDNVSELIALITIQELGLGKDTNNAPIGIAEFVSAFSLTNLESIIERNLGYDYQAYKDMLIFSQWFTTDRIVYNDRGNVTTVATDLTAGNLGTITRNFLISLRSYMKTLQIPTYRDGYYGLVLNPNALAQYLTDLTSQERFVSPEQSDMVTRMLQQATGQEFGGVVSGYRGTHDGFHIFEQNIYGVGAPGDIGVQSVTLGAGVGARTMDTNFAFGADTVAWATAMPVEIRESEITNYSRRRAFVWISHEGCGELDIKNSVVGNQLRVIQLRNARVAV